VLLAALRCHPTPTNWLQLTLLLLLLPLPLPLLLLLQFISSRDEIDEEYQRRLKEQMKKKRTTSLKTSSVTSTGEPLLCQP
jgi:hypothetical protein